MKVAVIMNAGAGSIGAAHARERSESIREVFVAAGVEAIVHTCPGSELTATAREAATSGVDAVVAAGGDGTVSAVASALVGGDVPLAVLPLGTLNHFARDLGMPTELGEAAQAIAAGTVTRVDAGEVNGRTFVNNSSIGLYPLVVKVRDAEQRATGHGKWRAMLTAIWRVLRRFPLVTVHVENDRDRFLIRTPFLFVGNNAYEISPLSLGTRARLDGGRLSLYTMRCRGRLALFWLTLRAIFQRLDQVDELEAHEVREVTIDLPRRRVPVALDGEVAILSSPLRYAIRPGALPVVRPRAAERKDEQTDEQTDEQAA